MVPAGAAADRPAPGAKRPRAARQPEPPDFSGPTSRLPATAQHRPEAGTGRPDGPREEHRRLREALAHHLPATACAVTVRCRTDAVWTGRVVHWKGSNLGISDLFAEPRSRPRCGRG